LPEASAREQASQREGCLGLIMVFHMIGSVVGTAFAWSMTANLRGFDDELPPPEADYVLLGVAIVTVLLAIRTMIRAPLLGALAHRLELLHGVWPSLERACAFGREWG
jgi:hypothetical protein